MEQLLISTAADRAIAQMPGDKLGGKAVFVEFANLDCLDKPYVMQRIRQAVLEQGAALCSEREGAEVVLEVASGALSLNKRDYLLGIPEIPLPIPFSGSALVLPELALFKLVSYRGRAKMTFTAVDTGTDRLLYEIPLCYGDSLVAYWSALLFFGPYEHTDLPKE